MTQSEFIDILMRESPQELNRFIEEKGKKPKAILPYDIIDKEKYQKEFLKI